MRASATPTSRLLLLLLLLTLAFLFSHTLHSRALLAERARLETSLDALRAGMEGIRVDMKRVGDEAERASRRAEEAGDRAIKAVMEYRREREERDKEEEEVGRRVREQKMINARVEEEEEQGDGVLDQEQDAAALVSMDLLKPLAQNEAGQYLQYKLKDKLAILIAFRDGCGKGNQGDGREQNLKDFRTHMKAHLQRANPNLDYVIIVAEQTQRGVFNKGALFNSALLVGIRLEHATYVVFHDVDQVPESPENDYSLKAGTPLHMCVASSQFDYRMAYETMVGGAIMMTIDESIRINGFSNMMDGWGLEDDDLYRRISQNLDGNLKRLSFEVGRYKALAHPRVMGLDEGPAYKEKYGAMMTRNHSNGLSNVNVRARFIKMKEKSKQYMRFLIDVKQKDGVTVGLDC